MKRKTTDIKKKYLLIQKNNLTQEEVKSLCECGNARAAEIRREITEKVSPMTLPAQLPTHLVIEHEQINIDYIIKVARAMMQN